MCARAYINDIITPRACARGQVIGFVCRLSSVVSTKISRSDDIGIWATHKYNVSVNIVEKLASVCFESFDKAHECRKSWILRFVGHAYGHFPLCASMCPALPRMLELLYTTCLFYLKHNQVFKSWFAFKLWWISEENERDHLKVVNNKRLNLTE